MGMFESKKRATARKGLWITVAIEICVLLALVVGLVLLLVGNPLKGAWHDAGGMVYKFSPNGKGVLVLEDDLVRFNYKIKGHTLHIDFDSDEYEDCSYEFSVEKGTLYLDDGREGIYTRNTR